MTDAKREKELNRLWVELEWRRCAKDETYFIENYVWIPSMEDPRGRTRFNLFDYQEELLDLSKTNRFVIALKARQIGFTTLGMAHALWLALFRPGATILIVSETQKSSNKNLAQARLAYQFLPPWMKERGPKIKNDSSTGIAFEFNDGMVSNLKANPATGGVFAGETATFVLWDEAALVEPASLQEDVLRTLLPTTDAGGSMMIVSTARGAYNRFAKTYRAAQRKESQFVAFFRPWMVSPFMRCGEHCNWCGGEPHQNVPCNSKYDLKRREFADQPWRFFQEYPETEEEAFRESGRPRFVGLPPETDYTAFPFRGNIEWRNDHTLEFVHDDGGPLHLATLEPDPKGFYVIGADPSQGVGNDYATAHVLTLDEDGNPEIVGYYHSNITHPTEFASALDRLGRFFSGREWAAKLAVEDQGGQGSLPINELHRHLDYPNPYMHTAAGSRKSKGTRLFAFPMTVDRRRAVIDRLAKYLIVSDNQTPLRGIHPALRVELGQFVAQETANGNIRYAADVGCHDDLVMSLAIGLWILIEEYTEASPQEANTEEVQWRPKTSLNLSHLRESRNKMIEEMEEQQRQAMESFVISTEMLYTPRGYRG
jgi:hypothetical protein